MKIKFDDLPEGFEVRNGEIVEVKKTGGTTGDQKNYGLVTGPQDEYEHEEIKVKYSMSAVPRDEANIEAEGGETVLTDLNDDGNFGLYDIKGSRHGNGGVPLYLPEQSFVFSDFNKMKLTKDEMKQMGVNSKKRLTPAKVSKKYGLNEYYASLKDPFADDIQAKSAELMLDKNKMQLSKLAFIQEAKKDFEEGVPVTAFPFLAETGYDPIEYTQQVEDITRQQAQQKYIESLPPEQQMQLQALQQYMAQVDEQEQEMIDANTEQGALPPPTNMGAQQGMMPPPPEMNNQQLAQMGFEVEDMSYAQDGYELIKAQRGRNFKEREEREEREAAYYKEKEAIDSIPKQKIAQYIDPDGGWTYTIWQDSEGNKYQREEGFVNDDGIFVASSDDFSGHGGWITDPKRIAATENDENLQKFRGDVPKSGQVMDEGWDENIITETSDDNEFDPAVDKLDKVTAKDSNRKYFPTNNLRTVGPGQIDNPANPFNPLQDFIPLEELETPEKSLRKILNSDDIYGEITKLGEKTTQLKEFITENPELTDKIIEKNYPIIDKETLWNTLDDVEVSFLYGSDYDSRDRSLELYREDFNKNIEALKAQKNQKQEGNTSTTNQSPQTGGDYIDTILDYEKAHGGPKGAPLSIAGAFDNIPGIENASASEARQMARDYIEGLDAKYQDYPIELRKRMVDFEVNSEDPRAALMEAARVITPGEKKKLYTNGKLDKSKVDKYWQEYGPDVLSNVKNDLQGFVSKFDAAKHRSYKFTNDSDKNYNTTWGPRVDMWNEGFDYNNWKPGTYYKYDKDDGAYIKSNKATTKEAQEFLADPDGTNQSNTNVTTPSPKRNATATESKQSNFNFTNPNAVDPFATDSQFKPVVPGADKYQKNKDAYNLLEKTLTDVNDTEMQGIINESYNRFLENAKEQGLTNIPSKEELINEFLKYQKNNYNVRNLATEKDRFNPNLDKAVSIGKRRNQVASELFEKLAKENPEYEGYEINDDNLKAIQLYFQTLYQVDSEKDNPRFGVEQLGPGSVRNWEKNKKISQADEWYGNDTLNQFMFVANPKQQIEPDKEPENPVIKTKPQDEKINIQPNQLKVPYNPNDPRFWLQDLLKLNAIANRKRGKFYPWQPAVEDIEVDWVLEDPTRAIAAANEQMNIMAQGLGTFGGPQSFNARMSNIQGKNAANVANIIAGVHNRNINTTNRGLAQQAQFDYYIDKENRARNTKLYDDTMKVEQNALIEENFDREQYADALANAYTNMANTYNMNTLYDNYNIDPTTGGMVYFTNPTALDPSPYSAKSKMDKYFNFRNEFRSKFKYEPTETEIKYFMGIEDDDNQMSNYQREARAKGMGSGYNRGYDYTGQRGREINKLLPFFTGQVGI